MSAEVRQYAIIGVVSLVVVGTLAGPGGGTPPSGLIPTEPTPNANFTHPDPDHGVDPSIFPRLWSGDVDEAGASGDRDLLSVRDVTFRRPPRAVETWTTGDHRDFPSTGRDVSVHPPNANLEDELWIEDAYVQVFTVQPSTVAHIAEGDLRHYIRRSGSVLGTTDYRLGLPPDEHREYDHRNPEPGETVLVEKTVAWRLLGHEMSEVTLEANGEQVAAVGPTHTPRLAFDDLPRSTERLTLRVTISASFEKTVQRTYRTATDHCDTPPLEDGNETPTATNCDVEYDTFRTTDVDRLNPDLTVTDTDDVAVYELSPTASRTTFTAGGSALAVKQSEGDPWAMYRLPDGTTVHNRWHFYSARDSNWDTLVWRSESWTTRRPSGAIPLQVHAFPSGGGAYAQSEFGALEVTHVWGPERQPPDLPSVITVPIVEGPFSTGSVVVTQADEQVNLDGQLTVYGLVRGTVSETTIRTISRQRSTTLELDLLSLDRAAGTATVRVTLQDSSTGRPIDLRSRPGQVVVQGVDVKPNASGTAVASVPLAGRLITARYEPGPWWATDPVYASSEAATSPPTEWPDHRRLVTAGFTILLWLTPLLFGIFLIDHLLGRGRLWPPWRGIE